MEKQYRKLYIKENNVEVILSKGIVDEKLTKKYGRTIIYDKNCNVKQFYYDYKSGLVLTNKILTRKKYDFNFLDFISKNLRYGASKSTLDLINTNGVAGKYKFFKNQIKKNKKKLENVI